MNVYQTVEKFCEIVFQKKKNKVIVKQLKIIVGIKRDQSELFRLYCAF